MIPPASPPRSSPSASASASADGLLGELAEELAGRLRAGEAVDLDSFLAEHPEQAEPLRRLLPAIRVMADLGRSAAREAEGPYGPGPLAGWGVLGDYRIVREVGRGGMGVVYEARQISLDRRVALKVLPFAAALDARQLQRFQNEARAAAGLHHTHIVPVFAVGVERGVHYYAMQFIEGRPLSEVIRELARPDRREPDGRPAPVAAGRAPGEGPAPPADDAASAPPRLPTGSSVADRAHFQSVARLGIQAAEALEYAHSLGIVHRDIKPANLLLDARGELWVTDFGLAQFLAEAGPTLTGDVLGTLRYMSPEQALARRGLVDHRTDVYSLGSTLYELLTLRPAIEGADRHEILRRIAFEEPPAPRRVAPGVPVELETIVLKAMAKEPESRYATAQELADDLGRFLDHRPIRARRPSAPEQVSKWVRRHPSIAIAAVCTLLTTSLILALSIVLILREQAATREALRRAGEERENATRHAEGARRQSERARYRLAVALQSHQALISRLGDATLPDIPAVAELRRSAREHSRRTIEQLVDATSPDPQALVDSVAAYIHLANLAFLGGRIEECPAAFSLAIRLAERLIASDPTEPSYVSLLGQCHQIFGVQLYVTGARDEAIAQFHRAHRAHLRAVDLDRGGFEMLRRLRWFLATCPEARFRDPRRVLELTGRMTEQEKGLGLPRPWDPSRSPHWLLTGIALYQLGEFAPAIATLGGALRSPRQGPESLYEAGDVAMGWFVLAMAYRRAGDRARASDGFRTAARLMDTCRPRDAELMAFRAEAAAVLGSAARPEASPKAAAAAAAGRPGPR